MTQQGTAAAPAQAGKSSKSQASTVASTQVPASKKPSKSAPAPTQSAANTNNTNATATTSNPDAAAADADSGTPASPPGSRFAVQLGSFPDDASAKAWTSKLKAAGVPAYIEHRKQADGTTRTLLRAGPFADRTAASAAIAKVREAGLTSGSNNGSAQ
jgi:DedD protein